MKISELAKILRLIKKDVGDIDIDMTIETNAVTLYGPIQSVSLDYTKGTPVASVVWRASDKITP